MINTNDKLKVILPLLACPSSGSGINLNESNNCLYSEKGDHQYKIEYGIPILFKGIQEGEKELSSQIDYISHYVADAKVFNYFEEKSGGTEHEERRVHESIIKHFPKKSDWVLDVGCGCGWVASQLIKRNKKVVSLDISLNNVQKSLELYSDSIHFGVVGDGYCLPFKDSTFDCIICSEVIEHIHYPDLLAAELIRCLKPGSKLILTSPYKEVIKYSLCIHCNKPTPHNAHLHSLDENKFKKLFENFGHINFKWETFGNRVLLHLRTHTLLRFLNYTTWRFIDSVFNLIINKPAHILFEINKINDDRL
jgi:ubiquinone/menaquinone biosynthesis C-methylase UbiE